MSNKTVILKSFNTLFFDFLDDIATIYPENKEIKYAKTTFEMIRMGNVSILIKVWKTYIYDCYREQIDAGDIGFFIEKDYRMDLSKNNDATGGNEKILGMIENVRSTVRGMDDANRQHAANYITSLSQLSEAYAQG